MTPSRVGDVIKAVLDMSIVDFPEAMPLIQKGSVCRGGWAVNVGTNDPLQVTDELRTQLKSLIACASANGYQIGQTFRWVRIGRKVSKASQAFVRELSEPRGLSAWLPATQVAVNATLKSVYRDMNTVLYRDSPFFGVDRKVP